MMLRYLPYMIDFIHPRPFFSPSREPAWIVQERRDQKRHLLKQQALAERSRNGGHPHSESKSTLARQEWSDHAVELSLKVRGLALRHFVR